MYKTLRFTAGLVVLFALAGCLNPTGTEPAGGGSPSVGSQVIVEDDYNFVEDPGDTWTLDVVDTTPANGTTSVAPSSAVSIFFDDIIDPSSLDDVAFSVKAGGVTIAGTYTLRRAANGDNAVITFAPYGSLPANSQITVTLIETGGLVDDGANELSSFFEFSFTTGSIIGSTDGNLDFENGLAGWNVNGNGGTVSLPYAGVWSSGSAAAITTGDSTFENVSGSAQALRTSVLSSGAITVPNGANTLVFDFVFLSEEFKDYIGSDYDDTASVSINGPNDSVSRIIDSVNEYSGAESSLVEISVNPDGYRSGIQVESIDIASLGSPLTISFTITDIGDDVLDSMLMVDNIRFE